MVEQPGAALTREECFELLATSAMGRVTLSVGALPTILPVGFALLGSDVVFRPFFGAMISPSGVDVVLAFQADDFDAPTQKGWSIEVQGIARSVEDLDEVRRCQELSPPVKGETRDTGSFGILSTARMSGRRFASTDGWGRKKSRAE
jgi:hypothetical protein